MMCRGARAARGAEILLADEWGGRVAGVYRHCFNMLFGGGRLFAVFAQTDDLFPMAICTDLPPDTDFCSLGIQTGDRALVKDGILKIPGAGFWCDLSPMIAVDMICAPLPIRLTQAELQSNLHRFSRTVRDFGSCQGAGKYRREWIAFLQGEKSALPQAGFFLGADFFAKIYALTESVLFGGKESLYDSFLEVIGMGVGLTPSADDMVCGFAAFMAMAWGDSEKTDGFLKALELFVLREGEKRTTLTSGAFLLQASRRSFSDPAAKLMKALMQETREGAVAEAALNH